MQLAHMLFLSVRFTLYSYRSLQLLHWTVNVREQVTPVSSGGPSDRRAFQLDAVCENNIEADCWGRIGGFLSYLFLFCYQIHLICYDLFVLILHWESVLMMHLRMVVRDQIFHLKKNKKKFLSRWSTLKTEWFQPRESDTVSSPALRAKLIDQTDARHKNLSKTKINLKTHQQKPTSWA